MLWRGKRTGAEAPVLFVSRKPLVGRSVFGTQKTPGKVPSFSGVLFLTHCPPAAPPQNRRGAFQARSLPPPLLYWGWDRLSTALPAGPGVGSSGVRTLPCPFAWPVCGKIPQILSYFDHLSPPGALFPLWRSLGRAPFSLPAPREQPRPHKKFSPFRQVGTALAECSKQKRLAVFPAWRSEGAGI